MVAPESRCRVSASVPRPEYPRPQFVRSDWLNLNGAWEFEIDFGDTGIERGLLNRELSETILVPFCPESPLSGIGNTDFMNAVWYRKTVDIPSGWVGKRLLLHFQAVDYDTTVWANGVEVGRHRGGFTPFTCDLGTVTRAGESVVVVVRARDTRDSSQPRGKQSQSYAPQGCHYTRTTGIWQTVWLEPVNADASLQRPRITPDVANGVFHIDQRLTQNVPGFQVRATLLDDDGVLSTTSSRGDLDFSVRLDLSAPVNRRRLWSPGDPHLYDIHIELLDAGGEVVDHAKAYAGLRSIAIDGKKVKINGEPVFQRLVLDQGYYPDGVLTAPTDDALVWDIELSKRAGFNGARLHQKVFEERFLYHADRLGYLVWGEFADWGVRGNGAESHALGITYAAQWLEALERDYNHPAIIGWCPLNETAQKIGDSITTLSDGTRALFLATKAMDTSRPVLDVSGYAHRVPETDIYDCHDYIEDDFETGLCTRRQRYADLARGVGWTNGSDSGDPLSVPYRGQPYFVSEFGGFKWDPNYDTENAAPSNDDTWGYGDAPKTFAELHHRFESLSALLMDNSLMFGYCYTQLTDVTPEENGIYTFDRRPKFDIPRIRAAQGRHAGIEALAPGGG